MNPPDFQALSQKFHALKGRFSLIRDVQLSISPEGLVRATLPPANLAPPGPMPIYRPEQTLGEWSISAGPEGTLRVNATHLPRHLQGLEAIDRAAGLFARASVASLQAMERAQAVAQPGATTPRSIEAIGQQAASRLTSRLLAPFQYIAPNAGDLMTLSARHRLAATVQMPMPATLENMETSPYYRTHASRHQGLTAWNALSVGAGLGRMYDASGRVLTGIVPSDWLNRPLDPGPDLANKFHRQVVAKIEKATQTITTDDLAGLAPPGQAPRFVQSPFVHYGPRGQRLGRDIGQILDVSHNPIMAEGGAALLADLHLSQTRYHTAHVPPGQADLMRLHEGTFFGRDKVFPLTSYPGGGESVSVGDWDAVRIQALSRDEPTPIPGGLGHRFALTRFGYASGIVGGGAGSKWFAYGAAPGSYGPQGAQLALPLTAKDWMARAEASLAGEVLRGRQFPGLTPNAQGEIDWTEQNLPAIKAAIMQVARERMQLVRRQHVINQMLLPAYQPFVKSAYRTADMDPQSVGVVMEYPEWMGPELAQASHQGAYRWLRPRVGPDIADVLAQQAPGQYARLKAESRGIQRMYAEPIRANLAAANLTTRHWRTVDLAQFPLGPSMGVAQMKAASGDRPTVADVAQGLRVGLEETGQLTTSPFRLQGRHRSLFLPSVRNLEFMSGVRLYDEHGEPMQEPSAYSQSAADLMLRLASGQPLSFGEIRRFRELQRSMGLSREMYRQVQSLHPKNAFGGPYGGSEALPAGVVALGDEAIMKMWRLTTADELAQVKAAMDKYSIVGKGTRAPELSIGNFRLVTEERAIAFGMAQRGLGRGLVHSLFDAGFFRGDFDKDAAMLIAGTKPIWRVENGRKVLAGWTTAYGEAPTPEQAIKRLYDALAAQAPGKIRAGVTNARDMAKAVIEAKDYAPNEVAKWAMGIREWAGPEGMQRVFAAFERMGTPITALTATEIAGSYTAGHRSKLAMGIVYNVDRALRAITGVADYSMQGMKDIYQFFLDKGILSEHQAAFMDVLTGLQTATMGFYRRWSPMQQTESGGVAATPGNFAKAGPEGAIRDIIGNLVASSRSDVEGQTPWIQNMTTLAKLIAPAGKVERMAELLQGAKNAERAVFRALSVFYEGGSVNDKTWIWSRLKETGPLLKYVRMMWAARQNEEKRPLTEEEQRYAVGSRALKKTVAAMSGRFSGIPVAPGAYRGERQLVESLGGQAVGEKRSQRDRAVEMAEYFGLDDSPASINTIMNSLANQGLPGKEFPAMISLQEASVLEGLRQMRPQEAKAWADQLGRRPRFTPAGTSAPSFAAPDMPDDPWRETLHDQPMDLRRLQTKPWHPGMREMYEQGEEALRTMRGYSARWQEWFGGRQFRIHPDILNVYQGSLEHVMDTGEFDRAGFMGQVETAMGSRRAGRFFTSAGGAAMMKNLRQVAQVLRGKGGRLGDVTEPFGIARGYLTRIGPERAEATDERLMELMRQAQVSGGTMPLVGGGQAAGVSQTHEQVILTTQAFRGLARVMQDLGTATGDTAERLHKVKDAYLAQIASIDKLEKTAERLSGGDPARMADVRQALIANREFELGELGQARRDAGGGLTGRLPRSMQRALQGGQLMTGFQWFYMSRMWNAFSDPVIQASMAGAENLLGARNLGGQAGLDMGGAMDSPIVRAIGARSLAGYRFGQAGMNMWAPTLQYLFGLQGSQASALALFGPTVGLGITGAALGGLVAPGVGAAIGGGIGATLGFTAGTAGYLSTFNWDSAWRSLARYRAVNEPRWSWNPAEAFTNLLMATDRYAGNPYAAEEARGRLIADTSRTLNWSSLQGMTGQERNLTISEAIAGLMERNALPEEAARSVASWALMERRGLGRGLEGVYTEQARQGIDRQQLMMTLAGMSGANWTPGSAAFGLMARRVDQITSMPAMLQFQIGANRWSPIANRAADVGVSPAAILQMGGAWGMDLTQQQSYMLSGALGGNRTLLSRLGQQIGRPDLVTTHTSGSYTGLPLQQPAMWAMQQAQREQSFAFQGAQFNIQQAQLNIQSATSTQTFALEGQQIGLRRAQEDWQYGYAQRGMNLRAAQFAENQALNLRAFQINQDYQRASLAQNTAGFEQGNRQWGEQFGFSVDSAMMNRRHRNEMLAFQMAQQSVGNANWEAFFNLDTRQRDLSRAYTRQGWQWQSDDVARQRQYQLEDRAFYQAQSDRQWGWQMTDFDEAIRRSAGYSRKMLIRQRERATITRNEDVARRDVVYGREDEAFTRETERFEVRKQQQETLWRLEDERFDLRKRQHDEELQLQNGIVDLRKRQYAEQDKMEDRGFELRRAHHDQDVELQQKGFELQRGFMETQFKLQLERFEQERAHFEQNQALELEGLETRRKFELEMRPLEDAGRQLRRDAEIASQGFSQQMLDLAEARAQVDKTMADAWAATEQSAQKIQARLDYMLQTSPQFIEGILRSFAAVFGQGSNASGVLSQYLQQWQNFGGVQGGVTSHAGGFHGIAPTNAIMRVSDPAPEWVDVYPAHTPRSTGVSTSVSGGDIASALIAALAGTRLKLVIGDREFDAYLSAREGEGLYHGRRR